MFFVQIKKIINLVSAHQKENHLGHNVILGVLSHLAHLNNNKIYKTRDFAHCQWQIKLMIEETAKWKQMTTFAIFGFRKGNLEWIVENNVVHKFMHIQKPGSKLLLRHFSFGTPEEVGGEHKETEGSLWYSQKLLLWRGLVHEQESAKKLNDGQAFNKAILDSTSKKCTRNLQVTQLSNCQSVPTELRTEKYGDGKPRKIIIRWISKEGGWDGGSKRSLDV